MQQVSSAKIIPPQIEMKKYFASELKFFNFVSLFYEILNKMITEKKYYTENQEKMALYAKAMAHPVRIFILDFLADNIDKCCYSGDMVEELPIARSTLSEHLKELKKAGLIQGEINPPYIKYCINKENWGKAKALFNLFYQR
jgi:ArsR family transcriptional regulator, arsenate/arsenite/antimonite-responsive transcriptional repressor